MEMTQLRYFVSVARTRSFSRAASQCHVAQPSLSQQILKLESELGEPLFVRQSRGASLTPAGELLLPRAIRILEEASHAREELHDMNTVVRGRLVLGALPTIAPYFVPAIVSACAAAYPSLELIVHEQTTAQLVSGVEQGEVDLALTSLPVEGTDLEREVLFTEELFVALPTGHPLASAPQVRLAALTGEPFILMQEGHCLGDQMLAFCSHRGEFAPRVSCRSTQVETIKALVSAGLGISLVPAMAATLSDGKRLVFRSLGRTGPRRSIVLVRRQSRPFTRAASAVAALLRETGARAASAGAQRSAPDS